MYYLGAIFLFTVLYFYNWIIGVNLSFYYIIRILVACFVTLVTFLSSKLAPRLIEFTPAFLFIYTALNDAIILYTCLVEDVSTNAYLSLQHLIVNYVGFTLLLNCNYFISQFIVGPLFIIFGCLYAYQISDAENGRIKSFMMIFAICI